MRESRKSSKCESQTSRIDPKAVSTMVLSRCGRCAEFFSIYVLDWHVLSALLIPILFGLIFPLYWFVICPLIWQSDPGLFRPRSWIIGYWLFASLVWFIFLAICLYHMRSGHQTALRGTCGLQPSESTEDIWNEDKYIPETYLPTPEYFVSITAVQPSANIDLESHLDAKQELDETWDYNYEEHQQFQKSTGRTHYKVSEVAAWQASRRCPEHVKRKFSNFLAFPTPPNSDFHKSQEHFDLSSDEEDISDNGQSQNSNIIQATIQTYPEDEIVYASKVAISIDEEETKRGYLKPIIHEPDRRHSDTEDLCDAMFNEISERKGSIVSDAKFDLILASLQSLAIEIERDFWGDGESANSIKRTKSENNLASSSNNSELIK